MTLFEQKIPEGRLGRLARMAVLGARTGVSALTDRDGSGAAKQALEVLGNLRGLAAKVGQMASYVDGLVPEEHRDAYSTTLKALCTATPASPPEAVRRVLEEELKAPREELFAEWDEHPIASASIGQVHRARLHDGREVAVKVQHAGVATAVESDLQNAGLIEGTMAMLGSRRMDSKRVLEEIRQRFREELDYGLEAERQRSFARVQQGDARVHIPAVIDDRSGRRVLTSEFVRGLSFDEACQQPEELRRQWAEALWAFVFRGVLVGRLFNADPHPGNYIFHRDGRVSFLDHGCVQPIDLEHNVRAVAVHRAALERDEEAFRARARELLQTRGGEHEAHVLAYTRAAFEPLFASPYRMRREYVAGLVSRFREIASDAVRGKSGDAVPLPEGIFFMNRLQFGFYSVLARLDVEVDFSAVEASFLQPDGALR